MFAILILSVLLVIAIVFIIILYNQKQEEEKKECPESETRIGLRFKTDIETLKSMSKDVTVLIDKFQESLCDLYLTTFKEQIDQYYQENKDSTQERIDNGELKNCQEILDQLKQEIPEMVERSPDPAISSIFKEIADSVISIAENYMNLICKDDKPDVELTYELINNIIDGFCPNK